MKKIKNYVVNVIMKDKRKKRGREFEYWIKKFLQKQGYSVHLAGKKALWIPNEETGEKELRFTGSDIFGTDILALHPEEKPLFIQATLHTDLRKKLTKLNIYPFNLAFCDVQVWQKIDSNRIIIHKFYKDKLEKLGEIQRGKIFLVSQMKKIK